ncbi:MAG: ABC transporter ATP-binding protein [Kiritimatiellia bacterium]
MSKPAIQISGVTAGYGARAVLNGIDLVLEEGVMAGLLGPNGAGKSTLFRVITGLLKPGAGSVRLFGQNVGDLHAGERARLAGVVPQEVEVPMPFSVEAFVLMGRTARISRWTGPTRADYEAAERAMGLTDVLELRHRSITELSGGERQRAVVAMVLAQEPRLILLDEATSHLDINHRLDIMRIVERLNREEGVTVLLTSHDLNLAASFCPRIVLLDHGKLEAEGTPEAVLTEARLKQVYHCEIRVRRDPDDGAMAFFPVLRREV